MAKEKSNHPLVGRTFNTKDQLYRVQDVQDGTVFASKMIDDKTCQRGRPSKFPLPEIMTLMGVTSQSLASEAAAIAATKAAAKAKPVKVEEPIAPPVAVPLTEEEIEAKRKSMANLLAMFPPDSLNTDW